MRKILLVSTTLLGLCAHAQQSRVDTLEIKTLEEVSVIGTRASARTPMSYANITKDKIKRENLGVDIPYLLQMQPSVFSTSDAGTGIGYTSLRVRGVDATGINITVGGVPINDSESQAVFWVNMPDFASSVREIQIQRGVGTSSNGSASFGATINMSTDHLSSTPYAEVGLSGGSFGTFRRNVRVGSGRLAGRWSVDARLSKITSDGYVERGSVDLGSYFVQAGYFGANTVVKFLSFGGKEVTGIAWNGLSSSDEAKYGRRYNSAGLMYRTDDGKAHYYHNTDNYRQVHNHLVLTHRFSPELALNVTGHYTQGFGYTDEYRTGRKVREYALAEPSQGYKTSLIRRKYLDNDFYGIISSLTWTPTRWTINLGLSGNRYQGAHYGEIRWIKDYPTAVYPEWRYYDGDASKVDLSSYIKASYQVSRALSAFVDLQYRYVDYRIGGTYDGYDEASKQMQTIDLVKTFSFLNPKLGLFYQIDDQHHAYASVAVSHREPNRKTYTDATPSTYPTAERLVDYELGYGYTSRLLSLSANVYYMDYTDQLVLNGKMSDVGGMLLENVPDSYRLGLELQTAIRPLEWLRLDASLGLSTNRIKRYDYYYSVYDASWGWSHLQRQTYTDTPIAYSPSVVASGALTLTKAGFEASVRSQYVSSQYLDNTGSADRMLPAYHVMGLTLGYDIPLKRLSRWNVSLQINNLLNTMYHNNGYVYDVGIDHQGSTYSDLRYYPQAGINVLLGTTITF